MKPYYESGGITIYHGQATAVLAEFDTGILGGCITEPTGGKRLASAPTPGGGRAVVLEQQVHLPPERFG